MKSVQDLHHLRLLHRTRQSKALKKQVHCTTNLRRDEDHEAHSPVKVTFFFVVEPEAEFGLFAVVEISSE